MTDYLPRARDLWIGLNDIDKEGFFYWVDRVSSTSANTKWYTGEPSNSNNLEDCAELNYSGHPLYTINDAGCTLSKPGLCEARID